MYMNNHPIGIFDSGYGGLTVFKSIVSQLPEYDYIYLGDNARSPYGSRSFETVYQYTLQSVKWFFSKGCPLVILACNTASAKALRTIQQRDLPAMSDPSLRVLGVIRPTAEVIGNFTKTGHIGVLGTRGTVASDSYPLEIAKCWPQATVYQQACPMWVPLIENNEHLSPGADYFVQEYLTRLRRQSSEIDTILLACTHYPLLMEKLEAFTAAGISIVSQGNIVAGSLAAYLLRHKGMQQRLTQNGTRLFYTTDDPADFNAHAAVFYGEPVFSTQVHLPE